MLNTTQNDLGISFKMTLPKEVNKDDILFVCIGTDRSTGDALGPYTGTLLKRAGYNVLGTIDDPVHAMNLEYIVSNLPEDKIIIAIDACLGMSSSVGKVRFKKGSLAPGAGVHKNLPKVGDYNFTGIVNVGGFMEYFVLQNTRLSLVIKMAELITDVVKLHVKGGNNNESRPNKPRKIKIRTAKATWNINKGSNKSSRKSAAF